MKKGFITKIIVIIALIFLVAVGVFEVFQYAKDGKNHNIPKKENVTNAEETKVSSSPKKIYDKNGIVVTYDSVDNKNIYLTVTNNYGKEVTVSNNGLSINGIMIDSFTSVTVANKKTMSMEIAWAEFASKVNINEVKNFTTNLSVMDSKNTLDDSSMVTVDCADISYKQKVEDLGMKLLDDKGIKVYYQSITTGSELYETEARIVVENNTKETINFDIYEGEINGKETSFFATVNVYPESIAVGGIGIEEYKADEIKTARFIMSVSDSDYNEIISAVESPEIKVK